MGARVRLDLSEFFECSRQQSFLFLDYERDKTVGDVEEHIRRVFNIPDPVVLQNEGWHLPPLEDSRVLRDGDVLRVINGKRSKKRKKKRNPSDKITEDGHASVCNDSDKQSYQTTEANLSQVGCEKKKRKSEVDSKKDDSTSESCQVGCLKGDGKQVKEACDAKENSDEIDHTSSTSSVIESNNGTIHSLAKSETLSQTDRKPRRRRRKRNKHSENGIEVTENPIEVTENPCENPPYLHKNQLFGVGYILPPKQKQHIFFPDSSDEPRDSPEQRPASSSQAVTSERITQTESPDKSIENNSISSAGSAGELTKLLSLQHQRKPIVFERKKPDNLIITVQKGGRRNVLPEQVVKGSLLTEIPSKDSAICFKILKMVNYSPQMSEELIGLVNSVDVSCGQLEVKILYGSKELQEEKGKFSLDDEDTQESYEYVSLNWNELLEPRSCQISVDNDS